MTRSRLLSIAIPAILVVLAGCALFGYTARSIFDAEAAGDAAKVRVILSAKPELAAARRPGTQWTPLHAAVSDGQAAVVEELLAVKADPNAKDSKGAAPLHLAVNRLLRPKLSEETYRRIISLLLDNGADVGARDAGGVTPLHRASLTGDREAVALLLDRNADVNARATNPVWTPLHGAVTSGQADVVEMLLKRHADATIADSKGLTPLKLAEKRGKKEIADLLRKYGATE